MVTMTSAEAQDRFSQLIEAAQQEMVEITLHGRPAAFLVSAKDFSELQEMRRRKQAVADFRAWRKAADQSTPPEAAALAAALTDEEVNCMVHESR